jgi:hypothetical protein
MSFALPNDDVTPTAAEGGEFVSDELDDGDEIGADEPLEGDERMYTGEPVDDGERVRRPQQMNVGVENMEGGGEWPDPATPPSPAAPGTAHDQDRSQGDPT